MQAMFDRTSSIRVVWFVLGYLGHARCRRFPAGSTLRVPLRASLVAVHTLVTAQQQKNAENHARVYDRGQTGIQAAGSNEDGARS